MTAVTASASHDATPAVNGTAGGAFAHEQVDSDPLVGEVERISELLRRWSRDEPLDASPVPVRPPDGTIAELAATFGLTSHERDVVALVAAVELDGGVARQVAAANGDDPRPTPSIAMAIGDAPHWDAYGPAGPLRSWHLVDLVGAGPLMARPLAVEERVLHHLCGVAATDMRLDGIAAIEADAGHLSPAQQDMAADLASTLAALGEPAIVALDGDDERGRSGVARAMVRQLGMAPLVVNPAALPSPGPDLAGVARLIDREAVLLGAVPVIEAPELPVAVVEDLLGQLRSPVAVCVGPAAGTRSLGRVVLGRSVAMPSPAELRAVWADVLGEAAMDDEAVAAAVDAVSENHRVDAETAWSIAREVGAADLGGQDRGEALAERCRDRTRAVLDGMARRIEPAAGWSDLVLPDAQLRLLHEIAAQTRHRHTVHQEWGFAAASGRGLGVTAMFTGDSGTGKTLAAEVLANDLGLSLLVVDLGGIVSKWVGETEKNLSRVFDVAERSGAVLLFDEADSLFGKRGEVRHGSDRYANLEVSFLLSRMETYRGLAILTTNLKANVDRAFLRRLRFVVHFPFPDQELRARIWRCCLPGAAPTEDLDPTVLARLNLSGGSIRAIALSAAFAAAEDGTSITRAHVLRAAEVELAKVERSLSAVERGGLS